MSPVEWYYARGNKQMGPVVSAELRRLASTGEIRPEDLVWREGLTEWTLARNVRGLFEEEAHAAAVIADVLSSSAAGTPSSVASAATAKQGAADKVAAAQTARTPRRHLFDVLLDGLRARFAAAFVEKTAKVFRAAGSYGLFLAMLLVAAYMVIAAVKVQRLESLPSGLLVLLVLVALQYVAGKFCDALEHLNRTTSSNLSSSAFPDCCALQSLATGLAVLLGSLIMAVAAAMHSAILLAAAVFGVGVLAFIVCGYQAAVALNLASLSISIAPEIRAGEEAIGVATFSLKSLLRLVPVVFGAGVICGTVLMGYACYQAFAAADDLGGAGGLGVLMGFGPDFTARTAHTCLVVSAALPLVAYLVFLVYCLLIEVLRAFLILPGKIDQLAARDEEKQGGE